MQPNTQSFAGAEYGVLRLTLDQIRLRGDRLAALVGTVRRMCGESVVLDRLGEDGTSVEFVGRIAALRNLQRMADDKGLSPAIPDRGFRVTIERSIGAQRRCSSSAPTVGGQGTVLVVDANGERGRGDAKVLRGAGLRALAVGRLRMARTLLLHTNLRIDVIALHHQLPDGRGVDLLDALDPDDRQATVLVFDDARSVARGQAYRARGAWRYIARPSTASELVAELSAAVVDSRAWSTVDSVPAVASVTLAEPPRVPLDPRHAADRLAHLAGLSPIEREVGYWLLLGLRDHEIADHLGQSQRTAKRNVGKVLSKTSVSNRASLWAVLYQDSQDPVVGRRPDDRARRPVVVSHRVPAAPRRRGGRAAASHGPAVPPPQSRTAGFGAACLEASA